jgi:hypothetical protein
MRTSSEGKQASFEAEPYCQDENVAEADTARRSMSNPRTPITIGTPTTVNEAWRQAGREDCVTPYPTTRMVYCESSVMGAMRSLQSRRLVSSVVRHVKGSEGHLSRRINCCASNAGTGGDSLRGRLADSQCRSRGSETVIVGGVTSTQGERENRSQGEGSYNTRRDMTLSRGRTGRRHMETTP